MKLDWRFSNKLICVAALVIASSAGHFLSYAIAAGKIKTIILILFLPLFLIMITLIPRIGIQKTFGFVLLAFWIPVGFSSMVIGMFEIIIYAILILLIIINFRSDERKLESFLINFPWFPFILYILGALLTWSFSKKIGGEITIIRIECILPLALSMVIFLTVRSTKDAERFLWMILTSAAILGLLFLVGKNYSGLITLSNYAVYSGRLSMILSIPYMGRLEMLPQSTSNFFACLLVFAYGMWIFHPSFFLRTYAGSLCLLFGSIIVTTQGRGGAITAALGAVIISVYATTIINRKLFGITGIWIKFGFVCLVVIGGLWYLAIHSTNASFYQHGTALFYNPMGDANLLDRFQKWSNAIKLFLANPIFGIGLRGIKTYYGLDTHDVHNIFLFTVLSYGLIGFIGFLWILLRFLVAFMKGIQSGDRTTRVMCISSICVIIGFFLGLQPGEPYSIVMIWAPLAIAFAVSKLERNKLGNLSHSVDVIK